MNLKNMRQINEMNKNFNWKLWNDAGRKDNKHQCLNKNFIIR